MGCNSEKINATALKSALVLIFFVSFLILLFYSSQSSTSLIALEQKQQNLPTSTVTSTSTESTVTSTSTEPTTEPPTSTSTLTSTVASSTSTAVTSTLTSTTSSTTLCPDVKKVCPKCPRCQKKSCPLSYKPRKRDPYAFPICSHDIKKLFGYNSRAIDQFKRYLWKTGLYDDFCTELSLSHWRKILKNLKRGNSCSCPPCDIHRCGPTCLNYHLCQN